MKKIILTFVCVLSLFVVEADTVIGSSLTTKRKLANEIVMSKNIDFSLNGFLASNRVCTIIKRTLFKVASNQYVEIDMIAA